MRNFTITSGMVNAALALLLAAVAILAVQLIGTLRTHQRMAVELATIDDIKYGLLNADTWVDQVTRIIEKKINEFKLTPENRKTVKATLEKMLDVFITQADLRLRKEKENANLLKRAKEKVREKLIDIGDVKAGIPEYADKILDQMNQPKTRENLTEVVRNLLNDVSQSTFAVVDKSRFEAVRAEYQCEDRETCERSIQSRIDANHRVAVIQTLVMLGLILLLFIGATFLPGGLNNSRLALLTLGCLVLMFCGVLTPMIEVEARISELRFVLLGEPVTFTDQILYFQSKSVLDVVRVLTSTGKPDMMLVGVLIMTFSVIFPLAKLLASFAYLYNPGGVRRSAFVQFFALKSGKWSMADVFVIAIFMAYVGFSGIIESQLSTFAAAAGTQDVKVLTTNGTSLQIGFFLFLSFCLASMLTSSLIDSTVNRNTVKQA